MDSLLKLLAPRLPTLMKQILCVSSASLVFYQYLSRKAANADEADPVRHMITHSPTSLLILALQAEAMCN